MSEFRADYRTFLFVQKNLALHIQYNFLSSRAALAANIEVTMMLFSNPIYLVSAIAAMAGVTLLTRCLPTLLPRRLLDAPLLIAINKALPLSVMTLLIMTSLPWQQRQQLVTLSPLLVAEILALVVVLFSYHLKKQLLLSMLIGIISVNGFLWVFTLLGFQ